ncbi:LexA family protein [Legionella maioricensis]|uniref:Translesion error-prone DNA polymerase V autoproteolytic subunit n=1 Tax=Legionella maioricensis TaxID=2896528 RepID=A0A9X2D3G3_9GAMM|nr:translesion error-prone DNA polymerase V autoproteolytic subunit [Legionella maioricensis]MCL9685726.1 translesion error-prone DNA polymerase V autoproteolytic subunit [Legionella maioricensis]MCL9688986.1 translesion error-prone DNA polymerase V autoproteolytic subunit [Legionella maioricensis]
MSPRGGKRVGAGRPKGEPTKTIRVPVSQLSELERLKNPAMYHLPVFASKVQAGFPSPADDYIERYLDLNAEYIKHPSATFLVTATGDSMIDAGIYSGDVLIVDKSLEAVDGKIVIAAVNGELTVKRLSRKNGRVQLMPANSKYKPIDITDEQDVVIWGVVTLVLHEPI